MQRDFPVSTQSAASRGRPPSRARGHRSALARIAVILGDGIEGKGGTEKATGYFMQYLQSVGFSEFDIEVMRTRAGNTNAVRHLTTPFVITVMFFRFLLGRYDLAHVNIGPKGSTLRKIAVCMILVLLRVPYVVHLHGSGYDSYYGNAPAVLQYFIRFMFRRSKFAIVLGEPWREFAVARLRVEPERVRIVYNGVPDHGVSQNETRSCVRIVSIGLVGIRKGTDVLLRALALLPKAVDWRCVIGGNGEISRFERMSRDLGIENRVRFLDWVDETKVVSLLQESDIFVLASRYENQPLTILEAMAAGTPVVSTRIGAIPEQVADGVSGILVEPGDAQALQEALLQLIGDPQKRRSMGQAGRRRYEEEFSVKAFAENIVAVHREALAEIHKFG
jgi:glycosyltransferase involved in cell wall biosynthesis